MTTEQRGNEMTAGAESKVRVMSQWWLVMRWSPIAELEYDDGSCDWNRNVLAAKLYGEEEARDMAVAYGVYADAANASEHLRSLNLPTASTETRRGPMGADGRQDDYEVLGPVRTMVDMLTGSPMAAALRVDG